MGLDDGVAHRRPNLATAPTMISSAMAMMPSADDAPHGRGADRDAELGRGGFAARGDVEGRRVVAGDRLLGRRDARPEPPCSGRPAGCGRWSWDRSSIFQPLGACRTELDLVGRRGAGVGDESGMRASLPASARPLSTPSRPGQRLSRGEPVISSATVVVGGRVFRRGLHRNRIAVGADRARRADLQLHGLGLAGLDRDRVQLLAAVLLGEARLEVLRRLRRRARPRGCGRCRS